MNNFKECQLADAEILSVKIFQDSVEVTYKDWKENTEILTFTGAISCLAISPLGESLSHGTVETDDKFLVESCNAADESNYSDFVVFSLVSAWTELPVLKIVARGYKKCGAAMIDNGAGA